VLGAEDVPRRTADRERLDDLVAFGAEESEPHFRPFAFRRDFLRLPLLRISLSQRAASAGS